MWIPLWCHLVKCSISHLCTVDNVIKMTSKINPGKSSGIKDLRSLVIKDTLKAVPMIGQHLINLTITTSTIPTAWKSGNVIPLPKSGNLKLGQ